MKQSRFYLSYLIILFACYSCDTKTADNTTDLKPWHNITRKVQYTPEGESFICTNGKNRFTRAIYGTNTGFRFETSDFPEFGLYMPNFGGSVYLAIKVTDKVIWVKDADKITSAYSKGKRIYTVEDEILDEGELTITAVALSDADGFVVKSAGKNLPENTELFWVYGGASGKRFSRDGDLGADPADAFYIKEENALGNRFEISDNRFVLSYGLTKQEYFDLYENKSKEVKKPNRQVEGIFPSKTHIVLRNAAAVDDIVDLLKSEAVDAALAVASHPLSNDEDSYFSLYNPATLKSLSYPQLKEAYKRGEDFCQEIGSRVKIKTPDPYITPLGGVISTAEDGIWEDPGYLHGSIGWRTPLTGWRAAYIADVMGIPERGRKHFDGYAASQVTDVPVSFPHTQDPAKYLARSEKKWGTPMYSNGYICRSPQRTDVMHNYDMNLCFIDELLWHFNWTGDMDYVKKSFPLIKRHLNWEKQLFDPDNDGLYDAYCCIWASDALQYNSGGVTHSSAYNYRANKMAAEIAKKIGEDPAIFENEAERILNAINSRLWIKDKGYWAEYVDFMRLKDVHESAAIWTVYHAIDSDIHDPFKAYQATRYFDSEIPHIPVIADGLECLNSHLVSTTNWNPYFWSINNVAFAEVIHTALSYWQCGRYDEAFKLFKGNVLDAMYLGSGPGNITQISFYDAARGETYRDFADPVAMLARTMIQGLYGILPDLMNRKLIIKPGFPSDWNEAELKTSYIDYTFQRKGKSEKYSFNLNLPVESSLTLSVKAAYEEVKSVKVNGKETKWQINPEAIGYPLIDIAAGISEVYDIEIQWKGGSLNTDVIDIKAAINEVIDIPFAYDIIEFKDPQGVLVGSKFLGNTISGTVRGVKGHRTMFCKIRQGDMVFWKPIHIKVVDELEIVANEDDSSLNFSLANNTKEELKGLLIINNNTISNISIPAKSNSEYFQYAAPAALMGSNTIELKTELCNYSLQIINWNIKNADNVSYQTIDIEDQLNEKLNAIFEYGKYISPRSPYTTLQVPTQGMGNWCHPYDLHEIDDRGLRNKAGDKNIFYGPGNIPFSTPGDSLKKNIAFSSLWDNYPDSLNFKLSGKAEHAYLLMAGSSNHMQANFVNGIVKVTYKDQSEEILELILPDSWEPIERYIYTDGFAFTRKTPKPFRVELSTGQVSRDLKPDVGGAEPVYIEGGAAIVLDIPLDMTKELESLSLETRANELVLGIMSITLMKKSDD